jgi:murein DD-endopeptidase MepM/ murein hydrolase activator NlpD
MTNLSLLRFAVFVAVWFGIAALGDAQGPKIEDKIITPSRLGLPSGNARTSEPVTRVYKADDRGVPLVTQPRGYPFTPQPGYVTKPGEVTRKHDGVDVSTRPKGSSSSKPMDFKAGVNGVVVRAGGGRTNTITVKLADGTLIQYLHSSKVYVSQGDKVTPDTVIGRSGDKGATPGAVHVHVQARDKSGKVLSDPDAAFRRGLTSPHAPRQSNGSPARGDVGGILINPSPKRAEAKDDGRNAAQIIRSRPGAKARSWRIELPKQGADDDHKND